MIEISEWFVMYYDRHGFLFILSQIMTTLLSFISHYYLNESKWEYRKRGVLLGLAAQPFWFIFSYVTEAWLMFIIAFFYTMNCIKGVKKYYFDRPLT